jgi:uncharacterized membrane protein
MQKQETRSIIVKTSVPEAFRAWSNFENFPYFMKYIKSVTKTGPKSSHWEMDGPLGKTIEWDAETTLYEENKRIGWNTKDRSGGDIKTSGQVSFNSLSQGETEVTVMLQFVTQAGLAGDLVARLFADPGKQLEEDLSNFKAYMEGKYERTAAVDRGK